MTTRTYVLITGANGEIGHGLIDALRTQGRHGIIALDLKEMTGPQAESCDVVLTGDILDSELLARLEEYNIDTIYHLAALLSTRSEQIPETAHKVNVEGTMNLLQLAWRIGKREGRAVKFLFPSSIAAYGIPTLADKRAAGTVKEEEWNTPMTMYGANKLYCEHLGRYYSDFYRRLADTKESGFVDFRAIRFPGLISAFTVPSGGTSDYAPEMLHAAAQGKSYNSFVREDATISFMAMPDGVRALLHLAAAPVESLSTRVYNVSAFAPSAAEIAAKVKESFPGAQIDFGNISERRQGIVDSWPSDIDDSRARADWQWQPEYDFDRAFAEYLVPNITEYYKQAGVVEESRQ